MSESAVDHPQVQTARETWQAKFIDHERHVQIQESSWVQKTVDRNRRRRSSSQGGIEADRGGQPYLQSNLFNFIRILPSHD